MQGGDNVFIKHAKIVLIWRILILVSTIYGIYGGVYLAAGNPNPYFLLFYTTQSNLWCFLLYLYLVIKMIPILAKRQLLPRNLVPPWLKGGLTSAIIVTFLLYQFIVVPYCLENGAMHQIFSSSDMAVHYLSPLLVFIDFIFCTQKTYYNWKTPFQWLSIPFTYFIYIVARTFFNRPVPEPQHPYLYFFFDVQQIGVQSFIHNLLGITVMFLAVGYFLVLINQIQLKKSSS